MLIKIENLFRDQEDYALKSEEMTMQYHPCPNKAVG